MAFTNIFNPQMKQSDWKQPGVYIDYGIMFGILIFSRFSSSVPVLVDRLTAICILLFITAAITSVLV